MEYWQIPGMNRWGIELALRPNERIVCTDATVAVDEHGNVSAWFRNDIPVVITKER